MTHGPYIAVVGPGDATTEQDHAAEAVGRGLADAGAILVCGGLDGHCRRSPSR
ncbi:MAG: hypothetical protein JO046_25095 [Solirubrobacterales bacterium]|nr:hypothetical protein [Solirubrobacterales bacterium]